MLKYSSQRVPVGGLYTLHCDMPVLPHAHYQIQNKHPSYIFPNQHTATFATSTGDLVSTSQPKRLKKSTEERRSCSWDLQIIVSFDLVPKCTSNKDPILLMWKVVKLFLKVLPEVPGVQRGNGCFYPEGLMWAQNAHIWCMPLKCIDHVSSCHRAHISPIHFSHPLQASRIHDCARPSWKWRQTCQDSRRNARQPRNIPGIR